MAPMEFEEEEIEAIKDIFREVECEEKEFRDRLISEAEIAELLTKGCRSKNEYNALKYIEKVIEYKGLGQGIGNRVMIEIPGLITSREDYESGIDKDKIDDSREAIDNFLGKKLEA
jgi:hypothetical protein